MSSERRGAYGMVIPDGHAANLPEPDLSRVAGGVTGVLRVVDAGEARRIQLGVSRCPHCGVERPCDRWCTCLPWEEQAAALQMRSTTAMLNSGRWTPAGDHEVRLS
jgi:hypothetical protein